MKTISLTFLLVVTISAGSNGDNVAKEVKALNTASLNGDRKALINFLNGKVIILPGPSMETQFYFGPEGRGYIGNGNYDEVLFNPSPFQSQGLIFQVEWKLMKEPGGVSLYIYNNNSRYEGFDLSFFIDKQNNVQLCPKFPSPQSLAPKRCAIEGDPVDHPHFIDDRYDKYRVNGVLPEPTARDGHWDEITWPPR